MLLISTLLYAQQLNEVPNYVLPSPQAYEITKYGDIPVNETAGKISPSVPIYNYRAGGLSLPIALSYSGNGVRVSDLPTWTGNNWNLNVGGVITRVVKDLPDETTMPRVFYDESDLMNEVYWQNVYASCYNQSWWEKGWLNEFNCHDLEPEELLIPALSGYYMNANVREFITKPELYDTEADVFNFSFGGHGGSFVLDIQEIEDPNDSNNTIRTITAKVIKNESNLDIQVLGDFQYGDTHEYQFVITTTQGVKYYFGGYTGLNGGGTISGSENTIATEETQFVNRTGNGGNHVYGIKAKTSFYLTKIENYLGDRIQLEYDTKSEYEVLSMTNQTLSTSVNLPGEPICEQGSGGTPSTISSIKKVKNVVYNGKFLKRIWSNTSNAEVVFTSSEVATQNQYYRILKTIELDTKTVDLNYWPSAGALETSQNTERFFLTKVNFKDKLGVETAYQYSFAYNDLASVPNIDSYAQDYLGYYNGVEDNTNLLPRDHKKFIEHHIPGLHPWIEERINFGDYYGVLADREPYFEYATKGILKQITHPTGGFTKIEYEPVEKKILTDSKFMKIHSNMGSATPGWIPNTSYEGSTTIGGPYIATGEGDSVPPATVFQTQDVTFKLVINALSATGLQTNDNVYLEVEDLDTGIIENDVFPFPASVHESGNTQTVFPFTSKPFTLLQGHSYRFKIYFRDHTNAVTENNNTLFSNTPMYVNCSMSYISGYDPTDGLGIRVKRVKDYNKGDGLVNQKRYYYMKAKDVNVLAQDKEQVSVYAPFFITFGHSQTGCNGSEIGIEDYSVNQYTATLNSNAGALNFPESDAISFYRNVTISYGGDNFENGGIEKQFRTVANQYSRDFKPETTFVILANRYALEQSFKVNDNNKTNFGVNNGTLDRETVYKKENGLLKKIKETEYSHNYFIRDTIKNMSGKRMENLSGYVWDPQHQIYDLYFGLYSTYTFTPTLFYTKSIDYIDGIPLDVYNTNVLFPEWLAQDADDDGIINSEDSDFITTQEFLDLPPIAKKELIESFYRAVETETILTYNPVETNLPLTVKTKHSDGRTLKTVNTYPLPAQVNTLSGLSTATQEAYALLATENRIASPIQVESFVIDTDNNELPLSITRSIYKNEDVDPNSATQQLTPLLSSVQNAKGNAESDLENRVEYVNYDAKGNPRELKQTNGSSALYFWSQNRTPIVKITNCSYVIYEYVTSNLGFEISEQISAVQLATLANALPDAQISKYNYIPNTDYIETIVDPRGKTITYEYDAHYRLKYIKDQDGNILSKNEYNYNQN